MIRHLWFALAIAGAALAAPVAESTCVNPVTRKGWHTMTNAEKKAYLDAEVCLMKTPGTLGLRGAKSKFDELQSVHVLQSDIAHWVGQFFPFHRLYIAAHEQALREHCGYTGGQPYWAEERDAGAFSKSEVFNSDYGFGGDGVGADLCIQDGPFVGYKNTLGPGYKIGDHCIERQINDRASVTASQEALDNCTAKATFVEFWACAEAGPHGAGHGGVGAQMLNPISSPGDPLFYLHHAWLDRLWAKWQAKEPAVRLTDIGGNNKHINGSMFGFPGGPGGPPGFPGPPDQGPGVPPGGFGPQFGDPQDFVRPDDVPEPMVLGDPGNVTTLAHVIQMYGIVPDRTVGDVMDTQGVLCYLYD